jgi:hypothetical protein
MKYGKVIFNILILCFISSLCFADRKDLERTEFIITSNAIFAPLNYLLILKKGKEYGVIKFTKIGENKAEYEWYYNDNFGKNFINSRLKSGKGKVKDIYWTLIGRLSFQFGTLDIKCGKIKLKWSSKNIVYFTDDEGNDTVIQMAPTKWTDIKEVDVFNNNLIWYKYDENRKEEIISNIENLNE